MSTEPLAPQIPRLAPRLEVRELPEGGAEAALGGAQRLRLSPEAAWLLRQVDGRHTLADLAERLSARFARPVSAADARELLERTLIAHGLAAMASEPLARPRSPRYWRVHSLAASETVARVAPGLAPLVAPAVALPLAAGAAALLARAALRGELTSAAAWREPWSWALALPLLALSLPAHEWLHAAALARHGGKPGAITFQWRGLRFQLATDLAGVKSLSRRARITVDLAGLYAQWLVLGLVLAGAALAGRAAPAPVVLAFLYSLGANLWPVPGSDGRWLLDDLAGRERADMVRRRVPVRRWLARLGTAARWHALWALGRPQRDGILRIMPVFVSASFPAWPAARLRAHTRDFLISRDRDLVDQAEIPLGGQADELRHVRSIRHLRARGQGAIVCAMHTGPYMFVPVALAELGCPVATYAAPNMQRQFLEGWQEATRVHGASLEILSPRSASSAARGLRGVRAGKMLVIYMDGQRGASRDQHRADFRFMGNALYMRTGPALLAQRAGVPLVLAATWREGVARRVVEFSDPLPPPDDGSEAALVARTSEMYAWFERQLAPHMAQWEGWAWPLIHWRETGTSPTASVRELEATLAEARAALAGGRDGVRLVADDTHTGWTIWNGEHLIVHGPERRVMLATPLATAVLAAAHQGRRVRDLPRRLREAPEALAPEIARLVLAGLAELR